MIIPARKQAKASGSPLVRIAIVTSLADVFEMCGARSIQKQKSVPVASHGIPNIGIHINQTFLIAFTISVCNISNRMRSMGCL